MNCKNLKKMLKIPFLALLAVPLLAGISQAVTYNLAAVPSVWTTPDTATPVNMWSFITVTSAASYNCATPAPAWDVGPTLEVPAGDNLTINIRNCLSESVSLFIPGQTKSTVPQFTTDAQGRQRVTSFDYVTAADSLASYTWNSPREGTYLYQSGTFVAKQVPKGLYGALIVRGTTYPAAAQEAVLVYSEIDPVLNNAGTGARINNYAPQYFLINGDTYPDIPDITVTQNTDVMLRFVNAGLQTYVPTVQGIYMSVRAEDGNLLPYPLDQYQLELQAAKTRDVIVNLANEGRHALFDRSLHLTDSTTPSGGMLAFIQTSNNAPVAVADTYNAPEGGVLTVAAPGVLANDTDADGDTLAAYLTGTAPPGDLTFNTNGSFTYTPFGGAGAIETFQYFANDGIVNSNTVTVTINVNPNMAPIAGNDLFTTPRNVVTVLNILANDVDSDGTIDPTTVTLTRGAASNDGAALTVNADGTVTYDPTGTGGGPDYFWYTVNDAQGATSNEARVRINRVRAAAVPGAAPAATPETGRERIRR